MTFEENKPGTLVWTKVPGLFSSKFIWILCYGHFERDPFHIQLWIGKRVAPYLGSGFRRGGRGTGPLWLPSLCSGLCWTGNSKQGSKSTWESYKTTGERRTITSKRSWNRPGRTWKLWVLKHPYNSVFIDAGLEIGKKLLSGRGHHFKNLQLQ